MRVRPVTILLDNDDAGRRGAEKRATSLVQHGAIVKVAQWPERVDGWDATDELRENGVDSLRKILDAAEVYELKTFDTFGTSYPISFSELQPLPEGLPLVKEFDVGLLPEAFRPWVEDIAERMQCPIDFPAVAAMVSLSAVVGRQVGIRPKARDNWQVVPNLWGA